MIDVTREELGLRLRRILDVLWRHDVRLRALYRREHIPVTRTEYGIRLGWSSAGRWEFE